MGNIIILTSPEAWEIGSIAKENLIKVDKEGSICIVNSFGYLIFQFNMDYIRPMTVDIALAKARQAAKTGKRTSTFRDDVRNGLINLGALGIAERDFVPWAGGAPIYNKSGILLGGGGISNLKQEEDEYYIITAIEKSGFLSEKP